MIVSLVRSSTQETKNVQMFITDWDMLVILIVCTDILVSLVRIVRKNHILKLQTLKRLYKFSTLKPREVLEGEKEFNGFFEYHIKENKCEIIINKEAGGRLYAEVCPHCRRCCRQTTLQTMCGWHRSSTGSFQPEILPNLAADEVADDLCRPHVVHHVIRIPILPHIKQFSQKFGSPVLSI